MPATPAPSVHDLRAQFESVLEGVLNAEAQTMTADTMERRLLGQLLALGYCLQVKVLSHMSSTRISAARGGKGSVAAYTPYFHEPFAPTHGCRYAMRLMRLCNMAAVRLA